MVNLNGHEAGNSGYGQEEPEATAPVFYSTLGFVPRLHSGSFEESWEKSKEELNIHSAFGFGYCDI